MSDWQPHTITCNPQKDKTLRIDIHISREADPFMMPFFGRIWNWRDALALPSKFAFYSAFSSIHMVPGAAEHKYQGTHTNFWKDIETLYTVTPNPVSRTDLWLTVRDPPALSTLRVVFTFDVVQEFDINMNFKWESWRTAKGTNVINLPPYKPTVHHKINNTCIWFTDNMETAHPDGTQHKGSVMILGEP